jgi:hypothetical protein
LISVSCAILGILVFPNVSLGELRVPAENDVRSFGKALDSGGENWWLFDKKMIVRIQISAIRCDHHRHRPPARQWHRPPSHPGKQEQNHGWK